MTGFDYTRRYLERRRILREEHYISLSLFIDELKTLDTILGLYTMVFTIYLLNNAYINFFQNKVADLQII